MRLINSLAGQLRAVRGWAVRAVLALWPCCGQARARRNAARGCDQVRAERLARRRAAAP